MKTILTFILALLTVTTFAGSNRAPKSNTLIDTVKIQVDASNNVYYQKTVKVTGGIMVDQIYNRTLQFMAAKNFVQTYGDDQEWKLIFTTSQDLNINPVYIGDDNDTVEPYTVQLAIMLDMKNGSYRYTINNVVFSIPTATYNRRETLFDMFTKATNTSSKRVAKNAKALIASFERYLGSLTDELHQGIEQKALMYNPQF